MKVTVEMSDGFVLGEYSVKIEGRPEGPWVATLVLRPTHEEVVWMRQNRKEHDERRQHDDR